MTQAHIYKKIIGTSTLLIAVLMGALIIGGKANALFTFIGNDLNFTGTVTQVGATSFSVDKGGTYPFVVVTNGATDYNGAYGGLGDVQVGDKVEVNTREDQGMLVAKAVENVSIATNGYGSSCEAYTGSEFWVSAIEQDYLYLSRANITMTVQYDANTTVLPGSQSVSDLMVGETIAISGDDCQGSGLIADTIVRSSMPVSVGEPSCGDYTGIGFYNSQVLLSHDAGGAFSPLADFSLPAGDYNVYGVSFDDHGNNSWDTLGNESWYLEGYDAQGDNVYDTSATDDLGNSNNRNATMIGSGYVPALAQARLVHAAYPDNSYQSVLPECVIFVPVAPASPILDL